MPAEPAQLPLALPARPARGRGDFLVSDSNRLALAQLDAPGWTALALVGPPGAGKSHLAAVWAGERGARVIPAAEAAAAAPGSPALHALAEGAEALALEDLDRALVPAAEATVFHLLGLRLAAGRPTLVTAREAPARWPAALPDLRSRLAALPVARLAPPDDALMEALATKLLADRWIRAEPGLARWLALRTERSHAALAAAVAALDRAALARRARVGRRLAAEVLGGAAED